MMKFGGGGGFFAPSSTTMLFVLLIFFFMGAQISDAVMCPYGRVSLENLETKNCSACTVYWCGIGADNIDGLGCPEHFFRDCVGYYTATDYIKYYNPLKACYSDGNTQYVSGCENEFLGKECIINNVLLCNELIKEGKREGWGTPQWPYYNGSNGIKEGVWKLSGMILLGWTFARFY